MRTCSLFTLIITCLLITTSCRDPEETALEQLEKRDYGFVISDFHQAAADGDEVAVREFLAAGMKADVEAADGTTAFHQAIANRHDAVALILLEAGAHPDQRLANGRTALMEVATRTGDDMQLLDTLLGKGADPRALDASGMTAMMAASLGGHVDAVRRLVERDLRSLDKALMLASASGHTHCMEVVIEHGAYVNCRSHDTRTPLMLAAAKGHQQAALLLLQHQANRFATDDQARTAADWADVSGHPALAVTIRDTSSLRWAPDRVAKMSDKSTNPLLKDLLTSIDGQTLALTEIVPTEDALTPSAGPEPERPILDPTPNKQNDTNASSPETPPSVAKGEPTTKPKIDLQQELKLGRYEERFIPIMLTSVAADDQVADIRILTQQLAKQTATIRPGEVIPNTKLRVTKVTKRTRTAKGGHQIDVSEMETENIDTGTSERFVVDSLSRNPDSHLIVRAGKQGRTFAARRNDRFTIAETGQEFQVVGVRPHQLLLRNLEDNSVLTIERQ